MLLLALLSNLSLSLALVANRASLPPARPLGALQLTTTTTTPALRHRASFASAPPRGPSSLPPSTRNDRASNDGARFRKGTALSAATAAPSSSSGDGRGKTILATSTLILLDVLFRSLFLRNSIPFPSSLAGCGALFSSMILLCALKEEWGNKVYDALNPGAMLLAKWLPVFFVPSLITLPLASGLGDAREVLKVVSVIVGGFLFTLFTTAWSVLGIRKLMGDGGGKEEPTTAVAASSASVANAKPPKPFSKTLFRTLKALAWITGGSAVALARNSPLSRWIAPLRSAFLLSATLSSFVFGANLPKSFTKAVHPLVTCTTLTWCAAKALASLTGSTFLDVLRTYKMGSLSSVFSAGAGDALLFLLGPAVVALAIQMYGRKRLMRENVPEVAASTLVSSLGGLYGTALAVRLLNILNPALRLSLLSRNITSPLAMAIAAVFGADASLAVTIVVVTGLIGANFGASILDAAGIRDAVARGLGIGAAAHGLGTAAFAGEGDAFPFAAIAMALTASACTVLASTPAVRRSVLAIALG